MARRGRRCTSTRGAPAAAHGLLRPDVLRRIAPTTRGVSISKAGFASATPCLPGACAPARSRSARPAARFHRRPPFFMQRVANFEACRRAQPLTVHFTFQYSDTPDYPHGKRQRAREAGRGRLIAVVLQRGPLRQDRRPALLGGAARQDLQAIPERLPQRHGLGCDSARGNTRPHGLGDGAQRNADHAATPLHLRSLLGLFAELPDADAPTEMPMPFRCSQDALFEIKHWSTGGPLPRSRLPRPPEHRARDRPRRRCG